MKIDIIVQMDVIIVNNLQDAQFTKYTNDELVTVMRRFSNEILQTHNVIDNFVLYCDVFYYLRRSSTSEGTRRRPVPRGEYFF